MPDQHRLIVGPVITEKSSAAYQARKEYAFRVDTAATKPQIRAAIDELYTEDCVLYVPPGTFVGREALDKFAGDLRATHPHFAYTPHGEPQALHNASRLAWGSGPRGEAPEYTSMDVIIVCDGKIAALYVFLDSIPS